jgi:hypothetical protein
MAESDEPPGYTGLRFDLLIGIFSLQKSIGFLADLVCPRRPDFQVGPTTIVTILQCFK